MNKQWITPATGILNIISGVVQLMIFVTFIIFAFLILASGGGMDVGKAMWLLYAAVASPLIITGILAIIGGVCVMRNRRWKLAYLGTFTACFPFILILSIIMFEILPSIVGHEAWWIIILIGSLIMMLVIAAAVLTLLVKREPEKMNLSDRPVRRMWLPLAAGILNIISGAFQLALFSYASCLYITRTFSYFPTIMVLTPSFVVTGIVAIVGGIYALQMKKWHLVYFGALAASIPPLLISIYLAFMYRPSALILLLFSVLPLILSLLAEKRSRQPQTLQKEPS